MRCQLIGPALVAGLQAGFAAAQPVIQAIPERPRIIVSGYGEVKTPPDLARIGFTARGEGSTSDDAVRAMVTEEMRIETSLHSIDSSAEPRTGEVRVAPVKSEDCKEQSYGPPQLSTGPCAILGYVAMQSVTVRTRAVKDAGTMVGLVARGGGLGAQVNSFSLQDPHASLRQATAAALGDAASRASTLATASHVSLGPILSISTSAREPNEELIVTGSRIGYAPPAPPPPPPVAVHLTPEPITTGANVTVTYAIGQ